jgi:hypothetical protein
MRYAARVFSAYRDKRKVVVFAAHAPARTNRRPWPPKLSPARCATSVT